jgi:hypothetical protein
MSELNIMLRDEKTAFAPRETIHGTAEWRLGIRPRHLELSLFWYTSGKGTRDVGVLETKQFDAPGASGSRDFSFALPDGPYGFSGKLISLIWAIEMTASPGHEVTRQEITLSPTGREIVLGSVPPKRPVGHVSFTVEPRD